MDPLDAFAPPKSPVADPEPARIPGLFKGMLAVFFALEALGLLVGHSLSGIVWLGVMALSAWFTLQGRRAASRVLGCLLAINVVLLLVGAVVAFGQSMAAGALCLGGAAYLGVLVGYIFLHPGLQAVFRKSESRKWSGG